MDAAKSRAVTRFPVENRVNPARISNVYLRPSGETWGHGDASGTSLPSWS
jgi:hypothetical protein